MFKKCSPQLLAFLQATGLVIYVSAVSLFFGLASHIFDKSSEQFYAPIIFLLLFIMSAVISALLVLGKAGILFWDKKYQESFTLLGWTVGWDLFYLALLVVLNLATK